MTDLDTTIGQELAIENAHDIARAVLSNLHLWVSDERINKRMLVIPAQGFAEMHMDFDMADRSFWVTVSADRGVVVYRHAKEEYRREKFTLSLDTCDKIAVSNFIHERLLRLPTK